MDRAYICVTHDADQIMLCTFLVLKNNEIESVGFVYIFIGEWNLDGQLDEFKISINNDSNFEII